MQWFQGNHARARALLEEAVAIGKDSETKEGYIWALANLGSVVAAEGNYSTAQAYLVESLAEARKLGAPGTAAMGFSSAFLGDVFIFKGEREQARQAYEEAVICLRELNNKNFLAYPLRRLAEFALERGEYEKATALCEESLSLNINGRDQRAIVACLAGFAAICAARGQVASAVRLCAAVEVLLRTFSASLLPADRQAYDRNTAMLRSQLDETTFDIAWGEGSEMALEQAIEFALKDTQI
jgi:tetratricopeptide (TPR) repeat protein